jgi:hypothetical protein
MGLWDKIDTPAAKRIGEQKSKLFKQKEELAKKMQKKGYGENGQYHDPKFYKH